MVKTPEQIASTEKQKLRQRLVLLPFPLMPSPTWALAVGLCGTALLVPAQALASQPIVIVCSDPGPDETTFTIDLDEKTVVVEINIPTPPAYHAVFHGSVISVSDAEIVFKYGWNNGQGYVDAYKETLNRYTGRISWEPMYNFGANPGNMKCHQQGRQF